MFRGLLYGGAEIEGFFANLGFAFVRVSTGSMIAFAHGLGKMPPSEKFIEGVTQLGFPAPVSFAWAASMAELGGGILLTLGLLTRPSALAITFTMSVAAFLRHAPDPFDVKEKALLFLLLSLVFVFLGSGRYGFDRRLRM